MRSERPALPGLTGGSLPKVVPCQRNLAQTQRCRSIIR